MRFKEFVLAGNGDGGNNANMPVRSKYATQEAPVDAFPPETKPDDLFGFKSPEDKIRSRERRALWIHKRRKRVPTERIPPDTIN